MIWGTESLSFHHFSALVERLPYESRTARDLGAVIVGAPGQWGNTEELLAAVIEVLGDFRSVYIKTRPRKKGSSAPNVPVLKIPRPARDGGQDREQQKPATSSEIAAFMGARGVIVDYSPPKNEEG